jgi:predicted SPOUT superfamily RNA methylase MTH1
MTVSVLVPSSLAREAEDKREATRKLGYVARAATVFRVDRIAVFPDSEGERRWGGGFVETVLEYAATPPYLRKAVWGERDELEYAGVLPPLRAVSQTGSGPESSGSLRQGIVTEVGPDGRVRVNCGMQHPISLVAPDREFRQGERVTVRISSRRPVRAKIVDDPNERVGFEVTRADLSAVLGREGAGVRIGTSRHGTPVDVETVGRLAGRVERDGATVAFGAPERGLPSILGNDAEDLPVDTDDESGITAPTVGGFDLWLDTIPNQGSEVVRTEEAAFATLALLNLRA